MARTIIAGVVAGIVMFMWMGFAHTVLPVGHMGVEEMPNEDAVTAALTQSLGEADGLYFYPGFGLGRHPKPGEMKDLMPAYKEKLATTPHGIVIYHPPGGGTENEMRYYLTEAALEIVEATICAFLLVAAGIGAFLSRVLFVGGIGAVVAITTNGSYWNWYGFPVDYTMAQIFMQVVGFLIAGIVIALIVKKKA
jgi:hypothetical protein